MSVVLDVDDNETYPSRFTIFAGNSKNQKKMIKNVYVYGNQSVIKLIDCQEEVRTLLYFSLLFVISITLLCYSLLHITY
jgi:hypothetical protein